MFSVEKQWCVERKICMNKEKRLKFLDLFRRHAWAKSFDQSVSIVRISFHSSVEIYDFELRSNLKLTVVFDSYSSTNNACFKIFVKSVSFWLLSKFPWISMMFEPPRRFSKEWNLIYPIRLWSLSFHNWRIASQESIFAYP